MGIFNGFESTGQNIPNFKLCFLPLCKFLVIFAGIDISLFETYEQLLDAFLREKIDLMKVHDKSVLQKIYQFMPSRDHIFSIEEEFLNLYFLNFIKRNNPFNNINIVKEFNF